MSVVLPCLNEAASVRSCVREAFDGLASAGMTGEVVVVDNGSTDGSAAIAEASGALVVHEPTRGYGAAVLAGIGAARGAIVVMADADCSYNLGHTGTLVRPIVEDWADLVIGSRLAEASRRTMPALHRYVGGPALSFLVARASGGEIAARDSQSGFRAFRRDSVLGLGLRAPGMEFASEMLVRASRQGLRVTELPTGYRPRVGQSKLNPFADGWRHLQVLIALAPDLLLVGPGAALLSIGIILSALGLITPAGLALGSLHWQPVFFSTIALVVGTQALLAGAVLAHRLSVVSGAVCCRFQAVGHPRFLSRCVRGGAATVAAGLVIDGWLFALWVTGRPALSRSLALAGLAQSLIIVGTTLAMFGLVAHVLFVGRAVDAVVVADPRVSG